MPNQPHPTVTSADVERIVRRDFPAEQVAEVLALLDQYGTERHHHEVHRVRMAALKIAAGNLKQLREQIEVAKCDYRDVLAPAEYPGYSFAAVKLPPEEQQRIIDSDWAQYQEWIRGPIKN